VVYVKRDAGGAIVAVSQEAGDGHTEAVDPGDPELREFLDALSADATTLHASDQDLVRVLEDLVDLLMAKGVILFTELPASAQRKIMRRQRLRSELGGALDLIDDDPL